MKETLLAYHFLRTADGPLTADVLDQRIEDWFRRRWETTFDFEIRGGLDKLRELELLTEDEHGALGVVGLPEAKQRLDRRWDNLFRIHTPTSEVIGRTRESA
ncbi:hypothetical protein HLB23_01110 [Nocardia uniformis]|uniref:Uncharacterized protein n=1 Tax=Nocardia uniformis TaxID=53432 RepID=A0A849BPJ7_9NOCA|nr:hypothetical protein [Nocardia uniformis]NNH68493.1 hypothetical protein [Nocardia uniformis]